MKRVFLALMFVLYFASLSWGTAPAISLNATYIDDGSMVNFSAIEPYRDIKFRYAIFVDTLSANYSLYVLTDKQNISKTGHFIAVGSSMIYEEQLTFSSEEIGYVSLNAYDTNGQSGVNRVDVKAIHGDPPHVFVSGVKVCRSGFGNSVIYPPSVNMELEMSFG